MNLGCEDLYNSTKESNTVNCGTIVFLISSPDFTTNSCALLRGILLGERILKANKVK